MENIMAIQLTLNANSGYGVPVKIFTRDVEEEALNQLRQVAQLQFIHSHVAVMPDVHAGIGATVGSVRFPAPCSRCPHA